MSDATDLLQSNIDNMHLLEFPDADAANLHWRAVAQTALDEIRDLQNLIESKQPDVSKIEKGLRQYLQGFYPNPRIKARAANVDGCEHGRVSGEDCSNCDHDYLYSLLPEGK